jgi:hypothetical protein
MEMDVKYRLAGTGIVVVDNAKPSCRDPFLLGNGSGFAEYMADQGIVLSSQLKGIYNVLFRHDEEVQRRNRRNILDDDDQVILINLPCRDISPDYPAKQAIFHPCLQSRFFLAACVTTYVYTVTMPKFQQLLLTAAMTLNPEPVFSDR